METNDCLTLENSVPVSPGVFCDVTSFESTVVGPSSSLDEWAGSTDRLVYEILGRWNATPDDGTVEAHIPGGEAVVSGASNHLNAGDTDTIDG